MKKAIKDLTQEEIKRICKKHLYEHKGNCIGCPFYENIVFRHWSCVDIPKAIKEVINEYSNNEVEIPEEEE